MKQFEKHLLLPGFTQSHQQKLEEASVCIIGAGALGIPAIQYLSAAGLGTIGVVDNDRVEESNLARQVLYNKYDSSKHKLDALKEKLQILYPDTNYVFHKEFLDDQNALRILSQYAIIVDASDNFQARHILDKYTLKLGIPFVYGSVHQYEGQASVFNVPGHSDNRSYQDLNPSAMHTEQNTCNQFGVWGPLPGIIGAVQAGEVLKYITGLGEMLAGQLLVYDAENSSSRTFTISKSNKENRAEVRQGASEINYNHLLSVDKLTQIMSTAQKYYLINISNKKAETLHIPGSIILNTSKVFDFIKWINEEAIVIIYCHHGQLSTQLVHSLLPNCPENIQLFSLSGGIQAWRTHNHIA